jgi:excinuclease ABC subunit C
MEAFLLESELIKKHRPKYNVILKDDKSYSYIEIFQNKLENNGKQHQAYGVRIAKRKLHNSSKYFGPYPDGKAVKIIIRILRKPFPFKDCSSSKYTFYQKVKRPCLYGDISLCPAPCVTNDFCENNKNVLKIKQLITKGGGNFTDRLEKEMSRESKQKRYENASKIRDVIAKIKYVSHSPISSKDYIQNPSLKDDLLNMQLLTLRDILYLKKIPKRIEIYDISNISGAHATGSMVVLTDGEVDKSQYKRFKIKTVKQSNDFAMIEEVVKRRFSHTDWKYPDLVVIDGGLGQLKIALSAFKSTSNIKNAPFFIGLAKKQETIVLPNGKEINLPSTNAGLRLLIKGRDEAHRFAKAYFTKLFLKSVTGS